MFSSPRLTDWEVKPTMRTRAPLHALRAEVKPTIITRIPLHALRIGVKPTIRTRIPLHALRVEVKPTIRTRIPLHALRVEVKPTIRTRIPLHALRVEVKPTIRTCVLLHAWRIEVKPTIRTSFLLHALRVERSNLPSGHAERVFFSTLYGLRGQTYHQDMHSSPRFTGWEVKPTIRTCVILHALRVERSNLPSGHAFLSTLYGFRSNLPWGQAFFSTLYGLRGQTYYQDMCSSPRFMGWEVDPTIRTCIPLHALRVERSNLPSGHMFFSTLYGWRGQTYHEDKRSSPRFTGWEVKPTIRSCVLLHALRVEVKPTIRTRIPLHALRVQVKPTMRTSVLLHALRVERSNLPSGHVFFSTLYGLRGQTYHQDMCSSPRFTGWEVKPTIRTCVLLHALRVERSNLPRGQAFFSTFTGWEVKPTIRSCVLLHALRVERSNLPSGHAFLSTLYGLRSNLPSGHAFLSTLYGLRSNLPSGHAFLSTLYGLRSNIPSEHAFLSTLYGLRSNLPPEHAFLSTLYGLRGQTYHQDMCSSPRFTGGEVKPTMRTSVLLHALRVERSNLPSGLAFFSTLYGLKGQTYHEDKRSSPRFTDWGQTYHQNMFSSPCFTGWEVKPSIRTCVLLHALRVERSNLPSGHVFFSTLYGLRGQTHHQNTHSSPRFTDWGQTYHQNTHSSARFTGWGQTYYQNTHSSPRFTGWGQTYHQNTHSSPRFTGWGQTYHQNMCSSPRLTDWEVKPTMRTRVPLHALRAEVKPTIRIRIPLHALRIEVKPTIRTRIPLHALRVEVKPTIRTRIPLHALRVEVKPTIRTRIPLHALRIEVKPTIRTSFLLHALRVERSNLPSGHAFLSTLYGFRSNLPWGQAFFSTLYGLRGQTYHQDMCSSPRFTGWEVKPTIRTCVPLHALWVERSILLSGHAFLSTLYGLRGQTYHQDIRSSPRFTGGEGKPTMRTSVLLHALRVERSNLQSGLTFFSTLYGLRSNLPSEHAFLSTLYGFRSNLPWGQAFFSTLYGLRGQTYHQDMCSSPRFTGWEVKPTIRICVPLHALRVERSNLPSGHAFFSTLYGLRGQTYHQDMHSSPRFTGSGQTYHEDKRSSPRFTGWEVKPTIRTCVLLHALRVERSNLLLGHVFFSTLYGLRGQTYHEDMCSSPRFTGWEVKPTIRSCVLLHALRVERSNLPSGHVFFSTLYGLRGQTYYQDMCFSPRFTVERSNLPSEHVFFSTLYGLRG